MKTGPFCISEPVCQAYQSVKANQGSAEVGEAVFGQLHAATGTVGGNPKERRWQAAPGHPHRLGQDCLDSGKAGTGTSDRPCSP